MLIPVNGSISGRSFPQSAQIWFLPLPLVERGERACQRTEVSLPEGSDYLRLFWSILFC